MSLLCRHPRTPIGVDFGSRCIKAVQLVRGRGRPTVAAATLLPRARPGRQIDPAEVARLRDVLRRQGFTGRRIVLATPAHLLMTAVQDLPARAPGVPIEQIARVELARAYKRDPQGLELGMWELPSAGGGGGTQVMAVGCETRDADALLDLFESHGLAIGALDAHACALARACADQLRTPGALSAVLDIGWESAVLLVVLQDTVIYQRSLPEAALQPLQRTLVQRLGLDAEAVEHLLAEVGVAQEPAAQELGAGVVESARSTIAAHLDATAAELAASFSYAMREYGSGAVARLLLVGGGASVPGADRHLAAALQVEVRVMTPADVAACPQLLVEPRGAPALMAALGLALFDEA